MSDSSAIDVALVAALSADAALVALLPHGVWIDTAPPNSTRYALVSLVYSRDALSFGGRAFEDAIYLVKAVVLYAANDLTAGSVAKDAAARIDAVLDGVPLVAAGYTPMACYREGRIRLTEPDDLDPTIRYLHRGGHYRVVMST